VLHGERRARTSTRRLRDGARDDERRRSDREERPAAGPADKGAQPREVLPPRAVLLDLQRGHEEALDRQPRGVCSITAKTSSTKLSSTSSWKRSLIELTKTSRAAHVPDPHEAARAGRRACAGPPVAGERLAGRLDRELALHLARRRSPRDPGRRPVHLRRAATRQPIRDRRPQAAARARPDRLANRRRRERPRLPARSHRMAARATRRVRPRRRRVLLQAVGRTDA